MDLIHALIALNPNHSWEVDKNSYDGIIWGDMPESERPTREVVEARLKELVDAQPLKELRQERDRRLQAVDWVAVKAFTTSTPVPQEWLDYMQALRDLPATTEDPKDPVWPTAPTS
jgi:hypothetical protein